MCKCSVAFQRWYGGARADAEAVGATTLGATHLGLEHKLELRAVDNLEPLDVAAMQHRVLLVALALALALTPAPNPYPYLTRTVTLTLT